MKTLSDCLTLMRTNLTEINEKGVAGKIYIPGSVYVGNLP